MATNRLGQVEGPAPVRLCTDCSTYVLQRECAQAGERFPCPECGRETVPALCQECHEDEAEYLVTEADTGAVIALCEGCS